MKVSKPVILLSVLVVLAIGIEAYMAQEPIRSGKSSANRSREPQNGANLTTLSKLLLDEGVRVDSSLVNLDSNTYRELRVRLQSSGTASEHGLLKEAGPGVVSLLAAEKKNGKLPRDRVLDLSPNQVLLIAVDASGKLRWWRLFLDPRLVRAEVPDASGQLNNQEHYLNTVDFVIDYPSEVGISEVRLYHPLWTGKEFQLELIGKLTVN